MPAETHQTSNTSTTNTDSRLCRAGMPRLTLIICLLSALVSGCTTGQAFLVGLMAYSLLDSNPQKTRETPEEKEGRHTSERAPVVRRQRPHTLPEVVEGPDRWKTFLQAGMAAYRNFQYSNCKRAMTRVINEPSAPATTRATAHIYRGASNFLLENISSAKQDFRAANHLGGVIDKDIFRPSVLKLYRRCAGP